MLHAASECSTWATSGSLQERDRVTPGRSVEFLLFSQYFLSVHASTSKPPRLGKWMTYNVMNISNGIANGNLWSSSPATTSLMASCDVIINIPRVVKRVVFRANINNADPCLGILNTKANTLQIIFNQTFFQCQFYLD